MLFGLRIRQMSLAQERRAAAARERQEPAAEPWRTDHPWRPESMPPDYSEVPGGWWLGRVVLLLFFAMINVGLLSGSPFLIALILVADLFALLLLYGVVRQAAQSLRFGRSRMRWATFPAFTGGRLEGTLHSRRPLALTGPVEATLRCVQDIKSSGGANDLFEPCALYTETRSFDAGRGTVSGVEIAFDLPADLPGTDLLAEEPVYLQVVVTAPVAGPDFEESFLAPVYGRPRP